MVSKTTRRRGRTAGDVGILLLGVQLLLSQSVAVAIDTTCPRCLTQKTHDVLEYLPIQQRRGLQMIPGIEHIQNITIAGKGDLEKIYALAKEMAARNTQSPAATPSPKTIAPTTTVQLQTPAPQSPTASSKAPAVTPTSTPVKATPAVASSLTPTKKPTDPPTTARPQGAVSPAKSPSQSASSAPIISPTMPPSSKVPTNIVPTSASSQVPITQPSTSPVTVKLSQSPSDVPSIAPSDVPSVRAPSLTTASTTPSLQPSTVPSGNNPSISAAFGSDVPSLVPSLTPSFFLVPNSTSPVTIVTGNSSFTNSTSILSCPNATTNDSIVLPYVYSMETDVHFDVGAVRLALEEILNIDLAPMLLVCATTRRRYLVTKSGIVGIDWQPLDIPSNNLKCNAESPNDVCNVFLGKMTLFVTSNTFSSSIAEEARAAIEAVFRVIVVAGLVKVTYLGWDQLSAASALQGSNSTGSVNQVVSNGTLGPSAIILFTTGSAAFVAAMGVFWYLRQKRTAREGEVSGAATQAAGTDTASAEYYNSNRPTSPFSEMLPSAYRFDHDMNMSAILETDEESQARSELLVSEGWVSDNDTTSSIDVPSVNYSRVTATPVLGARKRQEAPVEPFELCSL